MSMNYKQQYGIMCTAIFFCAAIFFAFYNQWIIIRFPSRDYGVHAQQIINKKQIIHHYFHHNKWKSEKQEILWRDAVDKNIQHLINAWLALLDEERITPKKTVLQSVLISTAGVAYLSFDHNILAKDETIFKKWIIIEGLLKTLVANEIPISHIQFLVQHAVVSDAHLDFSSPWPVQGFF